MRLITYFIVITTFFGTLSSLVIAQPLVVQGNPDNRPVTITLSPAQVAAGEIIFYFESRGNMSVPVYAAMNGPAGLRATLDSLPLKKKSIPEGLGATSGWAALETDRVLVIRRNSPLQIRAAVGYDCNNLNSVIRAQLEILLSFILGRTPTQQEICDYISGAGYGSGGGGSIEPTDPGSVDPPQAGGPDIVSGEGDGYVQARAVLHKDTCRGKKGDRYLVRARVNLADVDALSKQSGFDLTFTFSSKNYQGSTAASLKPSGEGKYPNPLLLMSALGGYGDNTDTVYQYRWKNGKARFLSKRKTEDYVYYQGLVLTRILADQFLTGGRTTFELTNGYSLYSVCMRAVRARQRINGYPG